MKKIYAFLIAAGTAMMFSANAATTPTMLWANNFTYQNADSKKITNIGTNIAFAADDDLLIFNDYGTTETSQQLYFGSTLVGYGTDYGSTSYNHNLSFMKVNPTTGVPVWSVYSNPGEMASNEGRIVPSSDGGAFVVAKVRHTINRGTDKIAFTDATGAVTEIDWVLDSASAPRFYKGLIMKISSEGAIQWYRLIDVNHDPQPNASSSYSTATGQAIYMKGVVVDGNDNIYIGGRLCTSLTFTKADGSTTTVTSQSSEGWTGDPQTSVGDMFIAKFDANGYFEKVLVQEGAVYCAQVFNMVLDDNKIYFGGYAKAASADNTTFTLGGETVDMGASGNVGNNILFGCLDTNLGLQWVKCYPNTYKNSAINKLTINVIGDDLWASGKARINFTRNGSDTLLIASKLTRDGYLIHLNAADGSWINGVTNGTNQSGFNGVFTTKSNPDTVYVYGHVLVGNLFIKKFAIESLEAGDQWNLSDASSDLQNILVSGDKLYTMSRIYGSKDVNVNYVRARGTVVRNDNGFNALISAFQLPFEVTSDVIEQVNPTGDLKVYAAGNVLHVVTDEPATVPVYNLMGVQVAVVNAVQGDNTITLPAGFYIAAGHKLLLH